MKRIIASAVAAMILLSGCGRTEKADAEKKTLAAQVSDRLDSENYDISFSISGGEFDGIIVHIARYGGDGIVEMNNGGIVSEFIKVNNETTMLLPEINCYRDTDYPGAFGNAFIKLGASDKLVSENEANGVITEVYTSPSDENGTADTFTFEFDSSSERLLRIKQQTEGGEIDIEMNKFGWDCAPISLPDLSEWDDLSEGALISETAQLKFSLYYSLGITERQLNDMGYTYDQIAHMKLSEQQALFDEFEKNIGK